MAEFIDNNAKVDDVVKSFNVSRSAVSVQAHRQGGFIRNKRLHWKPDAVAPKVAAKVPEVNKTTETALLDRVKNVLDEIEYLKFCGVVFDCRNGEIIALIEVKA